MPDRNQTRWMRIRLFIVVGGLLLSGCAVLYRIWTLQVTQSKWLRGLAEEQYLKEISLEPMRGAILDRHGAPLAVSVMTDSIFATPRKMDDIHVAARRLADILELDPASLSKRLASGKHFAWIKRRVTPEESEAVRALELAGVDFTRESRRFYPGRELAGSIVGFAGDGRGLEGIELTFDGQLRGATVLAQGLRDARGNLLLADGVWTHETAQGGGVVLTIDLTVQEIVETELQRAVQGSGARAGTAIVMVPDTGDILAMANVPTFNPNTFWKFKADRWRNRAVTDCYEPGSTMKVFTMAAVFMEGVARTREKIGCEHGNFEVGGHIIHDSHRGGFGELTPAEILGYSSNIGMAKLGIRLGRDRLYAALSRFGFGTKTGIDFPGESRCLLRKPSTWSEVGLATISFGQGVSVSPLQLVTALSSVANGGVWMRPRIVREIRDAKGEIVERYAADPAGRMMEPAQARLVTRMMVGVTRPGGTGTQAAVTGFEVAGKTGTAQKVDPIAGGYSRDKRVASFMGFVPANDPRIAVLVVVDEPTTSPYGGEVAGPAFARIAEATLRYLKVFPDVQGTPTGRRPAPGLAKSRPAQPAQPAIENVVAGPRPVAGQDGLPDVRGLSVREAVRRLTALGLNVHVRGSGRVTRQRPAPGSVVTPRIPVVLVLERSQRADRSGTELATLEYRRAGQ